MKNIGQFIREHKTFLTIYVLCILLIFIKIPYYMDAPGGLINVSERIQVEDGYSSKGSLNLAYVSEYEATIPLALLSFIFPSWDLYPKESSEITNESYEDMLTRDKLWMEEAYANAVIVAYQKAQKELTITDKRAFVLYVYEEAKTDIRVGDQLVSVEGIDIHAKEDLVDVIQSHEVGDTLTLEVLHDGISYKRHAEIIELEGMKLIGIAQSEICDYVANPAISISWRDSESGPSGGLMVALAVYNAITEEDITGGLTIVGTGTIDYNGNVGEIGGVAYKLKGAVHKKADLFFVPAGENYEEAMALKKEKKYDITIVPVSTFDDALQYLEENVF